MREKDSTEATQEENKKDAKQGTQKALLFSHTTQRIEKADDAFRI
jgi:hypothetical protein